MRFVFLALLLLLPACAKSSPDLVGRAALTRAYEKQLVGLTRDDVITRYGAPSRTVSLSDGVRIMEFHPSRRALDNTGRYTQHCNLRLWYHAGSANPIIEKVDYIGEAAACSELVL